MLSNTIEGWNEHLNDGLECLPDIPRDVYIIGCILRVGMNISMMD